MNAFDSCVASLDEHRKRTRPAAAPETVVLDVAATLTVHEAMVELLALQEARQTLRDREDDLRAYIRSELAKRDRKTLAFLECVATLVPVTVYWCSCHNVPAEQCATARSGDPVSMKAVACEPRLVVKR